MFGNTWNKTWTRYATWSVVAALWMSAASAFCASPAITTSKLTTLTTSGLSTPGQIVQDTCGDLYELDGNDNLYEIPAGSGGTATQLVLTGATEGGGLAIGPNNTLYLSSYQWDGKMLMVPSTNCVPQTSAAAEFASPGAAEGYWYFPQAVATDKSGNLFIATSGNQILEYSATTSSLSVLLSGLSSTPQYITVDANENVYYTFNSSGTIYEIPYSSSSGYASSPSSISTSLVDAAGMAFDSYGNLYITDSSTHIVYEIPYSIDSRALAPSSVYPVAAQANNFLSIAQDSKTLLYSLPQYWGTTLSELVPGAVNFGDVAIGSSVKASVNFFFNSTVAPSSIQILSGSGIFTNAGTGSCSATSYSSGSSCTVDVTFTPSTPGVAAGSVVLADSNGAPLATAAISGVGAGSGVSVDPGTVSTFGSGYAAPTETAIDNSGDVFFADSNKNAILEVPVGGTSAVVLASGFNAPTGVAVDGAGNLYVADTGNNQIVEIPVVNGSLNSSDEITVVSSSATLAGLALNAPAGIATDGSGNLYIADSGNKRVVYIPYVGSWDLSLSQALGSGMSKPSDVAIDASGNVYVSDAGNGNIYELTAPLSAGVQVTVASGYGQPSAVAVDASGSLFVVDQGNSKVWRIPVVSGTLTPSKAVNVTGQVNATGTPIIADPYGIALDPKGNLYVSDEVNSAAYLVSRTSSTQSFGVWTPGNTSGTLSYYVENSGNSALTLGSPFYSAAGDTTQFSILSSSAGECANSTVVAAGASCNLDAQFTPTADGNYTSTLTLSSNASVSGQQLTFTGTGAVTMPTTTTLAITSPSGSPSYDQAVALSATVSSSTGTPVGSVELIVDGVTKATTTLNNGVANFTLAAGVLSGGGHTLQATYTGGSSGFTTFSQSSSSSMTVNVAAVPTSTVVSFSTLYTNPVSQPSGTAIVFTATVSSTYAGVPTGTVTFTITGANGTLATGTGTLQPAGGGTFQATYTYANAATPASGAAFDAQTAVAVYSGDNNFSGSTSASSSFDVAPSSGSVGVTPSSTSLTAGAGSTTSISFTPTSYGGWNGLLGFSCEPSSLPAHARCVFSPGQTEVLASTASSSVQNLPVTMTVTIDQPPQTPTASGFLWWFAGPTGLLLFFVRRRFTRQLWVYIATILAVVLLATSVLGLSACGSSPQNLTPTGSSTITVDAWSDPFTAPPSSSSSTPSTVACPGNNPASAPCSQQSFQVSLTVQ